MLLSSFVSSAYSMTSRRLSVQDFLTEIFCWDHSPEKFWKNHPCSLSTLPVPLAPSPPYCTGTFQLCLPCLETSTMIPNLKCRKRSRRLLHFLHLQHQLSNETKPPGTRPELNQTPFSCANAIPGAGLCPAAASYLGLTSIPHYLFWAERTNCFHLIKIRCHALACLPTHIQPKLNSSISWSLSCEVV